jgi:hypothetical protein
MGRSLRNFDCEGTLGLFCTTWFHWILTLAEGWASSSLPAKTKALILLLRRRCWSGPGPLAGQFPYFYTTALTVVTRIELPILCYSLVPFA